MRTTYILSMLLLALVTYAQHYKTVLPDTAVYFINDSGQIRSIKIDTTYTVGSDTVYENFNTLRYDTAECDFGFYAQGASWLGERVLLKADGVQAFFNKNKDSIILKTLADTATMWRLFELDSGSYLEGRVSAITAENIFGVTDSVKTITLQAIDNDGNTFTHPLNGKEIKVSKHLGFTELLHFYEFPGDTMSYHIYNKGVPTRREIFDFEVGDKIQKRITSYSYYSVKTIYSLHHYIGKTFSGDSNTVSYTVAVDSHYYHWEITRNTLIDENHNKDTLTFSYSDLDQPAIDKQPGELFSDFQTIGFYEFGEYSLWDNHACGRSMRFFNYPYYEASDSCLLEYMDGWFEEVYLIEGLGILPPTGYGLGGSYKHEFQFYQTGGCSFGEVYTGISSPEIEDNAITLYPNPANSEVTMNFNIAQTITSITIHDITGKQLHTLNVRQRVSLTISTAHWNAGCYFVTIHTDAGLVKKKLLIQR